MAYSRKRLDLTGQKFGKLTALSLAPNIGDRTAWHCRCDCGRERVIKTCHLRSGKITSCGCDRSYLYDAWPENEPMPVGAAGRASLTYVDGTCVEMLAAKTVRRNNTSGVPGVDWRSTKGMWRASICFKGKRYYLGSYAKFEDAVRARRDAEERLIEPFLAQFEDSSSEGSIPSR